MSDGAKMKICYVVTENNGKSFWNRIGVAFVNRDGSLSVKLDSLPVSGEMQIRDYQPRDGRAPAPSGGEAPSRAAPAGYGAPDGDDIPF